MKLSRQFQIIVVYPVLAILSCLDSTIFAPFNQTELKFSLAKSINELSPKLSQEEGLLQDLVDWADASIKRPDFIYHERSESNVSYIQFLTTALNQEKDFLSLTAGSRVPFRFKLPDGKHIEYYLQLPWDYDSKKRYPVVIDLPGLGWLHKRIEYTARYGNNRHSDFIILTPINNEALWNCDKLDKLLDRVTAQLPINQNRIYLMGHSLGGNGVWEWAKHRPDVFAAISPASAWSTLKNLDRIKDVPVLMVHGKKDLVIQLSWNVRAADYLKSFGGKVSKIIRDDAGHDVLDWPTRQKTVAWLMEHRLEAKSHTSLQGTLL